MNEKKIQFESLNVLTEEKQSEDEEEDYYQFSSSDLTTQQLINSPDDASESDFAFIKKSFHICEIHQQRIAERIHLDELTEVESIILELEG